MAAIRSLVLGNLLQDFSTVTLLKTRPAQEFARDDVLISPSLDPYSEIARANRIVSSGKSLALDAAERAMKNQQQRG